MRIEAKDIELVGSAKYPYIAASNAGVVVLFTEEGRGVCLDAKASGYFVGETCYWNEQAFAPVHSVTLTSKG